MLKTKIICTIGPSTQSETMIHELVENGMDIARLNFSHGSYKWHKDAMDKIKYWSNKLNKPVALLCDLQGPKIRVANFDNPPRELEKDEQIILASPDSKNINQGDIIIDDKYLNTDVKVGDPILIDDGKIELKVLAINDGKIICKVIIGGNLYPHKGLNAPSTKTTTSSITEKDKKDLEFILPLKPEYIAISFVQTENDVLNLRKLVNNKNIKIISKIEKAQAIENFTKIANASDAIMVARGDLGVEIPIERLPFIQKSIIKQCNEHKQFVITATQMLASMVDSPTPTRAEVTDIANAVLDGTTAVLLSNETAVGKYPLQSLNIMKKIIIEAEKYLNAQIK